MDFTFKITSFSKFVEICIKNFELCTRKMLCISIINKKKIEDPLIKHRYSYLKKKITNIHIYQTIYIHTYIYIYIAM